MRSFSAWSLAFALLATGCGGPSFSTDFDPGADFSAFQTYSWAVRTDAGRQDQRVYNAITEQRVKMAVDQALSEKGYTLAESAAGADFLVAWHGAIEGKVEYQTVTNYYGYGWGWYGPYYGGAGTSNTYAREWDEGTLVVDVVDRGSNELVWRGSVTGELERDMGAEERQLRLNDTVRDLLRDFPPGT